MGLGLDQVAIPSRDPKALATFVAGILGTDPPRPDGADGEMFNEPLSDGWQPWLSQRIRRLEGELGLKLLEHIGEVCA